MGAHRKGAGARAAYIVYPCPHGVACFSLLSSLSLLAASCICGSESQSGILLASSAAELGVIFTSLVLITGPIWAKPVWGVWWTWDPRLTSTLVLWLIYVGYLMLRAYSANRSQGSLYSAVLGIIGFVDVPIVYFAVDWWRTQHQRLVVGGASIEGNLHPDMGITLLFSLGVFTLLFIFLLRQKMSLRRVEQGLEDIQKF